MWGLCYSSFSFMCMFCRLLFILFSFGHCIVCSWIYGFRLPLWYLQILLEKWKLCDGQPVPDDGAYNFHNSAFNLKQLNFVQVAFVSPAELCSENHCSCEMLTLYAGDAGILTSGKVKSSHLL